MSILKFDWNPLTGIQIFGDFKIHFYSLTWVAAFVLGWYITKYIFKREQIKPEYLDPLFMYTVLATMIGARLGHVLFYQSELISEDFFSIFLPFKFKDGFQFTGFQGLASHGAAIGVIIALVMYVKKYKFKSLLWLLDRVTIPVAIGGACIRVGNFINSEIIGKPTTSKFGVRFIQDYYYSAEATQLTGASNAQKAFDAIAKSDTFKHLLEAVPYRHPSQLYESFCYIIVFVILWALYNKTSKKDQEGFLLGFFLTILWLIRFFIEFTKEPQGDEYINWFGLNTGQWLSLPFIITGLFLMFIYKRTTRQHVN